MLFFLVEIIVCGEMKDRTPACVGIYNANQSVTGSEAGLIQLVVS
jgi:hypothetical protein